MDPAFADTRTDPTLLSSASLALLAATVIWGRPRCSAAARPLATEPEPDVDALFCCVRFPPRISLSGLLAAAVDDDASAFFLCGMSVITPSSDAGPSSERVRIVGPTAAPAPVAAVGINPIDIDDDTDNDDCESDPRDAPDDDKDKGRGKE
jgi:hypothetical protein